MTDRTSNNIGLAIGLIPAAFCAIVLLISPMPVLSLLYVGAIIAACKYL